MCKTHDKEKHLVKSHKRVPQMRVPLAARREPAGAQNRMLYVFEHKT